MLTFKQTVFLLVSIITILAIIAVVTGLSPLYWPHPKPLSRENNSTVTLIMKSVSTSTVKIPPTKRLKPVTKKTPSTTTTSTTTTLPITTHMISTNVTVTS